MILLLKKSLVAHRRAGFIVRWTAMGNFSIFSYMTDNNVYSMSQPCNEYMMYTVPMYIAFMIGYYVFRPSLQLSRIDLIKCCSTAERLSTILICIGLLFIFYLYRFPHYCLLRH